MILEKGGRHEGDMDIQGMKLKGRRYGSIGKGAVEEGIWIKESEQKCRGYRSRMKEWRWRGYGSKRRGADEGILIEEVAKNLGGRQGMVL